MFDCHELHGPGPGQQIPGFQWDARRRHCPAVSTADKRISAVMLICGTYDAAGEFAYRVGLLGKSGVGGGIIAVVPNRLLPRSVIHWTVVTTSTRERPRRSIRQQ